MKTLNDLTTREREIAEHIAWGASKKEMANSFSLSERTIENHTRNIYEKLGCHSINELSAWWFCVKFNISMQLSPLKRQIVATAMLALVMLQIGWMDSSTFVRASRASRAKTSTVRTKKTE